VTESAPHHVVIVGAGFGGLAACHGLPRAGVRITVVDQRNHHLFQPLLYQVGTAVLATSEIAWPIRHLLRRRPEMTTLLAVVSGLDTAQRQVLLEDGAVVAYDTLVIATGSRGACLITHVDHRIKPKAPPLSIAGLRANTHCRRFTLGASPDSRPRRRRYEKA
jgi:NADH dehydrogenase FAD-containing subunit